VRQQAAEVLEDVLLVARKHGTQPLMCERLTIDVA